MIGVPLSLYPSALTVQGCDFGQLSLAFLRKPFEVGFRQRIGVISECVKSVGVSAVQLRGFRLSRSEHSLEGNGGRSPADRPSDRPN